MLVGCLCVLAVPYGYDVVGTEFESQIVQNYKLERLLMCVGVCAMQACAHITLTAMAGIKHAKMKNSICFVCKFFFCVFAWEFFSWLVLAE